MQSLVALEPTRARAAQATVTAHQRFLSALAGVASPSGPDALQYKPLVLRGVAPLPPLMRVYLYNLTTHASERQQGAFRIQITLPNARGARGHFDWSDGAFVVLAGYAPELDVFALWDAGIYDTAGGIAHSRGCQVRDATLYDAMARGTAELPRRTRTGGPANETVIAATPRHLARALDLRWSRTVERLLGVAP